MLNIIWLSGWAFVYEQSGCEFESRCCHLNFRYCACFEQGTPWHSGNCRVQIHSETRTWHDNNIQVNVKAFTMITNKKEAKTMTKHISWDFKCKSNSTTCNSNRKWSNETCHCECKNYRTYKKDYSWNPRTCICENDKYLKSIADTSVI